MSLTNVSRRKIETSLLISDDTVNIRDASNYDIESLIPQILIPGRVNVPLHVQPLADGRYVILQGNRRYRAVNYILADPTRAAEMMGTVDDPSGAVNDDGKPVQVAYVIPPETVKALKSLDCIVYNDLQPHERDYVIYDHGSVKGLSRAEVVRNVWRLMPTHAEKRIALMLYHELARMTGSTLALNGKLEGKLAKDREGIIGAHFHGTLGGTIIPIGKLAESVREDYILSCRKTDKEPAVKDHECAYRWDTKGTRALAKAYNTDRDAGTLDYDTRSGPNIEKALDDMRAGREPAKEDNGRKPLTPEQAKERVGMVQSKAARAALAVAAGLPVGDNLAAWDTQAKRLEYLADVLGKNAAYMTGPVRAFADVILASGPLADIDAFVRAHVSEGAPILPPAPSAPVDPETAEVPNDQTFIPAPVDPETADDQTFSPVPPAPVDPETADDQTFSPRDH